MDEIERTYARFIRSFKYFMEKGGHGFQKEISAITDISQSFLSRIGHGKKKASFEHQVKISEAIGYSYEKFLELGNALLKADAIDGGHRELFKSGYKLFIDTMQPDQLSELYKKLPLDRYKLDAFLDGSIELSDDQIKEILDCSELGTYELFVVFGSKHVEVRVANGDLVEAASSFQGKDQEIKEIPTQGVETANEQSYSENIVDRFKNTALAESIINQLIELEKTDLNALYRVLGFIEGLSAPISRNPFDRRKNNYPDKIPNGIERRKLFHY